MGGPCNYCVSPVQRIGFFKLGLTLGSGCGACWEGKSELGLGLDNAVNRVKPCPDLHKIYTQTRCLCWGLLGLGTGDWGLGIGDSGDWGLGTLGTGDWDSGDWGLGIGDSGDSWDWGLLGLGTLGTGDCGIRTWYLDSGLFLLFRKKHTYCDPGGCSWLPGD